MESNSPSGYAEAFLLSQAGAVNRRSARHARNSRKGRSEMNLFCDSKMDDAKTSGGAVPGISVRLFSFSGRV